MITHGGDLDAISKKYNINKDSLIDFSGNIGATKFPSSIIQTILENIDSIKRYPDKNYALLKSAISSYCSCQKEDITVGNGATELISLFIDTYKPKKALILSPSYSEYERELKNINCDIDYFPLYEKDDFIPNIEELINKAKDNDLAIICNPNNPTGYAISNEDIKKILDACPFVMLDETYAEFEDISCINLTKEYKNLFIIRGTSKFFGVPGIRLGYSICSNKDINNKILDKKDLWTVTTLSDIIGITIFKDNNFIKNTKKTIANEKVNFYKQLSSIKSLKLYKSNTNFILCKILDNKINSTKLFEKLIKQNIIIRDAKYFPLLDDTFFRFCVLEKEENKKLIDELKKIFS